MRFGICNETFGDRPHERVCADVAAMGYEGLEIAPFTLGQPPAEISDARRRDLRDAIAGAGLATIGLHWLLAKTTGFHLTADDSAMRTATSAYLIDLARLCRDLDGTVLVLGSPLQRSLPPGVSMSVGLDRAEGVLAPVVPVLEDLGVTLALEPLGPEETNFLNTIEDAVGLADRLGSPSVEVHLDVKAMSTEPTPIPDLITRFASRAAHFHANDPNRLGPGMGDVPVEPWMAALAASEYDGWVSVEVFDLTPGPDAIAQVSLANMRTAWNTVTS